MTPEALNENLRITSEMSLQQAKLNINLQESQHRRRLDDQRLEVERMRTEGLIGQLDKATGLASMYFGEKITQAISPDEDEGPSEGGAPPGGGAQNGGIHLVEFQCPLCNGKHVEPSDKRLTVCPVKQELVWMVPPDSSLEAEQHRAQQMGIIARPHQGDGDLPPGYVEGQWENDPGGEAGREADAILAREQRGSIEPTWYGGGTDNNGHQMGPLGPSGPPDDDVLRPY
jgi:hypothetical protein